MTNTSSPDRKSSLEICAEQLEETGLYRVLRRLPPLQLQGRIAPPNERVAAIIDTETTGLDRTDDEVVEFAGITISYTAEGLITGALSSFSQLREPRAPLSADTIRLTGLTNADLKGKQINKQQLEEFIMPADIIIAHNAAFDRPFCEQLSNVFIDKPWGCSATEINWTALGYEGAKLTYLVANAGWFYDAHRALDDCNALLHILNKTTSNSSAPSPFQQLLNSARQVKTRLSFEAPYSKRNLLRKAGYRWNGRGRATQGFWYSDVAEKDVAETIKWLAGSLSVNPASVRSERIGALHRYR